MNLAAEGSKISVSLGPEWNMNSREKFAGGLVLGFEYNFLYYYPFALGLIISASNNFRGFTVAETTAMFRWYYSPEEMSVRFFAQIEAGVYLIPEDGTVLSMFNGGIRLGYRIPFNTFLYCEPYGRLGYPFVFGMGVMVGWRF
jgi:hypothetical protein